MGFDPDLGLSLVAKGDDIVAWLTDYTVVRLKVKLPVKVLEVLTVAEFLAYGPSDIDGLAVQIAQVPCLGGSIDAGRKG
jgi:hypothetical protein